MFSANLNRILKEKEMTHYRLAVNTGIGHDSISLYRNNKRQPTVDTLKKIAKALGVKVDELIKEDE